MAIYYLPDHIRSCAVNGSIIFLDAKNDLYFSYGSEQSALLNNLQITRMIEIDVSSNIDPLSDNLRLIVRELIYAQALVDQPPVDSGSFVSNFPKASFDLSDADLDPSSRITMKNLYKFIYAILLALIGTKAIGLYRLARWVNRRKTKAYYRASKSNLESAVYAFRAMRPLCYSSKDNCYFNSAVLMFYLISLGYRPLWIFGVKVNPFAAHCWVQVEEIVVSDYVQATEVYAPIMAI